MHILLNKISHAISWQHMTSAMTYLWHGYVNIMQQGSSKVFCLQTEITSNVTFTLARFCIFASKNINNIVFAM